MANNLKKFATEADYNSATLNTPAVSWVTATDNVHFDYNATPIPPVPPVTNDKVMMAWVTDAIEDDEDIVLFEEAQITPSSSEYFSTITLNDVDVRSDAISNYGTLTETLTVGGTDYIAKYGLELADNTEIYEYFSGNLGSTNFGDFHNIDFLIPSQITDIDSLPNNVYNLVIEATTPPTVNFESWSGFSINGIYVPTESVNAYQSDWSAVASIIYPISDYSGNLPV